MSFNEKISYPIGGKQVQGGLPTAVLNTLQFNALTNQWEFIAPTGGAALGDLEFLRDKQLSGDLIVVTGETGVASPITVISTVPAAGKTFFIAKSSHVHKNRTAGVSTVQSILQNDGTNKDIKDTELDVSANVVMTGTVVGDSLIGDGIRAYRVVKTIGALNIGIAATFTGWIQNT